MDKLTPSSLIRVIREIYPHGRERRRLYGVALLSVLSAVIETIGVAAILPFMILIIDPESLTRYPRVLEIAGQFGIDDARQLTMFFGVGAVVVIVLGNSVSALNIFVQQRFSASTSVRLASGMFSDYLKLPYSFHVKRDVASVLKVMLSDSASVVSGVVTPLIVAFGKALVALGLVVLLFLVDPVLSATVTLVLIAAYLIMYRFLKETQRTLGDRTNRNSLLSSRTAMETLAGVKELIVLGRERYGLGEFNKAYAQMTGAQALNSSLASLPKFILETLVFSGIVLVTLTLVLRDPANARTVVPVVALYGFAGYRMMPALQQVFQAAISLRFNQAAVMFYREDWYMLRAAERERLTLRDAEHLPEVHFQHSIELKNVTFTYPGADRPALRNLDLTIRPNESIGLVGRTGAGKTTLADLILGLYQPDSGQMTVDGINMRGPSVRAWQNRVGFVSQHVFLRNASIAENIALGIPPDEIDRQALEKAARRAQADEFIDQLPRGFESQIGAAGVRLSGGQRQRLGIARALYHEPEVLVFDEATSALDGLTEDAVMEAIRQLSGERTVILIAHRLRTVEACDRIVLLDAGQIVVQGAYGELVKASAEFRHFVGRHEPSLQARSGQ